jgi:surface antigen
VPAVVHAGQTVTVHFTPGQVLTCALVLSGPKYAPQHWRYPATSQPFSLTFSVPAHVRPGAWGLAMKCTTSTKQRVHVVGAVLHVKGSAHGTRALTGAHGPYVNISLNATAKNIGGGGGAVNPGFPPGQCTYYAWTTRPDIYAISVANGAPRGGLIPGDGNGRYYWDAFNWANLASSYGHFPVGATPVVGSIMVEAATTSNPWGHVAYVVQVNSATSFVTHEMNTYGDGDPSLTVYTVNRTTKPGMQFIYGGPAGNPGSPPPPPPPRRTR